MKKKIDINELLDAAHGEGFSPEQLAGVALLLSEYRGEIDSALETLKEKLRVWAVSLKQDDETYLMFEGKFPRESRGHVQVTFMGPSLRLKKGLDPATISGLEDLLVERVTESRGGYLAPFPLREYPFVLTLGRCTKRHLFPFERR